MENRVKRSGGLQREGVDFFFDAIKLPVTGDSQFVFALEIDPELGVYAKVEAQAQSGFRGDGALSSDDQLQGGLGESRVFGHAVNGKAVRGDEFLQENLTGMGYSDLFHKFNGNLRFQRYAHDRFAK